MTAPKSLHIGHVAFDLIDSMARVRRAVRYSWNDSLIAHSCGVPIAVVRDERAKLPKERSGLKTATGISERGTYGSNDHAEALHIRLASEALNAACWRVYRREGSKRGIPPLEVAVAMGMVA